MENLETLEAFERSVAQFCDLYSVEPEVVAVDAPSRIRDLTWARRHVADPPIRVVEVQHHHAHIAAVMAEHECDPTQPVIGFAFDGTGYGDDGSIWGGEVLVADANGFERVAHLCIGATARRRRRDPPPVPGGAGTSRCRAASSGPTTSHRWQHTGATELGLLRRQLERNVACVPTTSMGRLFDAVASLLGLRHHVSYEAQAAIELEMAADRCVGADRAVRIRSGSRAASTSAR